MKSLAISLFMVLFCVAVVHAQADDILRGARDGTEAGRREGFLMPVFVGGATATALALSDGGKLNNNQVVSALVVNTAASAAAVWIASAVLPPKPSRDEREMLAQQSQLYSNAWRMGFRESAGSRRVVANVLGVLTGAVVGVALYSRRAR